MREASAGGAKEEGAALWGKKKDAAALMAELGKLEKSILGYAKDLGLTPGGRAQLAKKRAGAAAEPDADLFGI